MKPSPVFKKFLSILNSRPIIVGSLTGQIDLSQQLEEARRVDVDLIEVRLDTFPLNALPPLIKTIRRLAKKPLLLTLRSPEEGGNSQTKGLSDKARGNLLKELMLWGDLVDIEIRKKSSASALTKFAHSRKIPVIHSFHDFKKLPRLELLNQLAKASLKLNGEFFKAAVNVNSPDELMKFLGWGMNCNHPRPILIAMGKAGIASRTLGYCFGSAMTFGHLGAAAAPGQPRAADLKTAVTHIFKPLSKA